MFTLQAVGKTFPNGLRALDGISAEIGAGEFVALLGPSGCGKSTLLRLLAGLDQPSDGRIGWEGGMPPGPGEIGFVFQDATLLPWADVAGNVFLPLRLRGVGRAEAAPRIAAMLEQVGLGAFAQAMPHTLSGGMRMRVSIARALISAPRLLLMDEPFAALDEFTRHKLQEDLRGLWRRSGKTVMFVTHSIYEAAFLASRILVMSPRPGRIAADLSTSLPDGPERRGCPEYAALVADITETFRRVMPA
ncbi:MAG TPA: ABC transporter ATP-binding protein [Acidocella sp.]|jgi:NitT/TauT family transport system ATP-binding protein|uniref:ABC transporter ATP-binding protein n=1 Tax=Acidocella sp. TaxID=50710 RepID=UPI002B76F2A2|nr:ABC transporter ATP-binding protein [Acidocella sp.]HVE23741.1 ABC transporter ATP-binding protein [Acidocella sp.]